MFWRDCYGKEKGPKRPPRDDFELEEIGNLIQEAYNEKTMVSLKVWGKEEPVRGRITKLDAQTRRVHVSMYGEESKIPFMDIMKVSSGEME
ncbi:YolD-like family protein [Paenibacillus larvae]|nr:YolD-like family protein [Paenibacillus larvae]MDT2237674.1 YolD-like family protein [Paenibacillus larvae]MDT2249482.1 YolD-like family protein [Paenibacillus larvae]